MSPAKKGISCFVIMPFGDKLNLDAAALQALEASVSAGKPLPDRYVQPIQFDTIYTSIIVRAFTELGMSCLRCDQIRAAGSIHEDMLRHIWSADVAVVDISTLNANVFYELGVRHTLHEKVTVLLQRQGTVAPFNIQGYRVITYDETSAEGIEAAVGNIVAFVREGLNSGESDSPVYKHLPRLSVNVGASPPERRIIESTDFYDFLV